MKKINFILKQNEKIIIKENNISIIEQNNKQTFIIKGIKYIYNNNILTKETKKDIVIIDFEKETCKLILKDIEKELVLNIKTIKKAITKEELYIKYIVESDNDITYLISIKYL